MLASQPSIEVPETPFGAVASRQLSVWPFADRTTRLFLLVDPSLPDQRLRAGLIRAMQQAYFRSDGCSQTRAVREAALAAHYVLRHHNQDVLPLQQLSAATAVAALRGDTAFVALAGDAAAFAWRDGTLTGQHGIARLARPLGHEHDPGIALWCTPLARGDRLVLVSGAQWRQDSQLRLQQLLYEHAQAPTDMLEERIAELLAGARRAGVLVVEPTGQSARPPLRLAPTGKQPVHHAAHSAAPTRHVRVRRAWLSSLLALVLLGVATAAALGPAELQPRSPDLEAEPQFAPLVTAETAPTYSVTPAMCVGLGSSGGNVVDLAVGDDALYTLDVVEASVRAFKLDARDQQPTPETLLVRSGAPIGPGQRRLAAPVAIEYLSGARPEQGVLAIVDQTRSVVQVGRDRAVSVRPVPSSASWRELGALGGDPDGHLFVLDSGARRLLEYPPLTQQLVDPPRILLDGVSAPNLAFDQAAQIVGERGDQVYLRMDDGTLHRFDGQGTELPFSAQAPEGPVTTVSAVAPDRSGGLYLVDPTHARILHTTADGALLRQLRDPSLGGVRLIQSSPDGRRLYGLVASGVLVFDLPE
jgi:hypothetical protein